MLALTSVLERNIQIELYRIFQNLVAKKFSSMILSLLALGLSLPLMEDQTLLSKQ
jgi:hypothetical protein